MARRRIALAHPTFWPEVRRGGERLLADLATELTGRGHSVTVITSHQGPRLSDRELGFEVIRTRRPPELPGFRRYEEHLASAPALLQEIRRGGFDLVHSFHAGWNWPLARAAGHLGVALVASLNGIPIRSWLVERRYRLEMLRETLDRAHAFSVLSEPAAARLERYLFHRPSVLPGGVRTADYEVPADRAEVPTLISHSSLGDPRKRPDLVFEAFGRVRERLPGARLLVVETRDPHLSKPLGRLPRGAELVEADSTGELAAALGSSWAGVLAAEGEAFGLVVVEALAAGTPMIVADADAPPELIDESCGWKFDPGDAAGLAAAMELALSAPPGSQTSEECRRRARAHDWARVGDRYEALYEEALTAAASS